ncbi:MAG: ribonuclease III [Oscillospiraceae bacterium]|nr:ribonuclease III [Oscillospiraceae bacterium]
MSSRELSLLEERLGYKFKNIKFLETGVTHSSFSNETKEHVPYNERQEFLGDAVLSIIVSDYIFENYTKLPEGELTKLRASLVCEKSLCGFSNELELGSFLRLGHGEELMGGRERPSILADAFEAVLAAVYLDGGIEPATKIVLRFIKKALEHVENAAFKDYKTLLQEIIQKNPEERLTYVLVGESGPDHDKRFEIDVMLNSNVIGHGIGKSKKTAEQHAAKEALELMGQ